MSENERKELSEKLHFGLALAERRMLEEKHCAMNALYKAYPMERLKVYRHVSCCVDFMEKS